MAEPLEVDPTISKLIQLIEEQNNAIRELTNIVLTVIALVYNLF